LDAELLVLCDPDLVFLRPVAFDRLGAGPGVLAMDGVGYMTAGAADNAGWLETGCERAGVDHAALRGHGPFGGVPYVVHATDRERLARDWLRCIEHFLHADPHGRDPIHWIGGMWAAVFAARREGIEIRMTELSAMNWNRGLLDPAASIIHYCLGDETFDKRAFQWGPAATWDVWDVRPVGDGTVSDRVRAEIADAAAFHGLADPDERRRRLGRTRDGVAWAA
jgi:hypothetical protein